MALRLTGTSLLPDEPARATRGGLRLASSGAALGSQLAAQASTLLAAHQLDAYRSLLTRTAEHDDPHGRYHARVVLLEQGLAAAGGAISASQSAQLFATVAEAALDVLEQEPREPVILNYAAIALYELWSLEAARALFRAARRLDPALPHLQRNLDELAARQRIKSRGRGALRPLHAAVPALAGRAKRVAERARPASGLTLSLCMIVRDEEGMLERCLAAAAPAVDELVIVDTGSQDRTIEIARSFGARVIEREWTGSFAEARNVSFEAATGDWILYLDADEVLVSEDIKRLRALTGRTWREAFYLVETSYTGEAGDGAATTHNALRMFRNRPEYRFEGRLHEQIAHRLPTYAASRIEQSSVRVEHFGYLGAVRDAKEKSRRNIELLLAQQAEVAATPFLHFNLGTEYAAVGANREALREFQRAWAMAKGEGGESREYTPALMARLVTALRRADRAAEAIEQAEEGLARFPGFTDLVFEQALASLKLDATADAVAYWQRCIEMGDAPARFAATVGSGTYLPRIALAEVHATRGELDAARELLDWCLSQHPDFIGVVQPYATVLLRSGVEPVSVAAEIEQRVARLTPAVRFMLGCALYGHGAMEVAEQQFREVLSGRPHSAQVRVCLAETLLHQRRYAEAAAETSAIADEDPFAGLARRIELWGRVAGGDLDGARAVSAGAAAAGVPDADLAMFAGWIAVAGGEAAPSGLPISATLLLGVILETLLEMHDFEGFETLLPLLQQSALPKREQHELLGSMYLRHGFLVSAAQEWMPVCEQAPDARALAGLAAVALANGQLEDAAVIADQALLLDPGSVMARNVLARCPAPTIGGKLEVH